MCMVKINADSCIVEGRKGVKIYFDTPFPEKLLVDKTLANLKGNELKKALNKPFIVKRDLKIIIEYKDKLYSFVIQKDYDWNGANVPWFAWLIIGQQKEPRFKLPSCVHDYMCEHHEVIGNNRYLSTLVFETLCEYFGRFNNFKRWAMFHSVDNYQKVCGKDLNKKRWGCKK